LESEGVYVGPGNYADEELFAIVEQLSKQLGATAPDLIRSFGIYLLPRLLQVYPDDKVTDGGAQAFLGKIGKVIHEEVYKLWPDARPPCVHVLDESPGEMRLSYSSKRKLCPLAEGLIEGTAQHFGIRIEQRQSTCLLRGDNSCTFELKFHDG
jgi:predicted hydrocarbon binding protein